MCSERGERRLAGRDLPRFEARLRADQQIVRVRCQRLAEDLLGLAVAVDVRRIDEVDAPFVDSPVEPARLLTIPDPLVVPGSRDAHGAERETADLPGADRDPSDRAVIQDATLGASLEIFLKW
jgi:hypothetical protein